MRSAWRTLALASVVAACLTVTACGGSSTKPSSGTSGANGASTTSATGSTTASSKPTPGGSLTVLESNQGEWPTGLDPATNTTGGANLTQMDSIYGQLWELLAGGKLRPDLATGYRFLDGGKKVVVTLRHGVKFSDGTPFNAQAVAWNWRRDIASPCTCKPVFPGKVTVTATGPYTVTVNLPTPDGAFIHQLLAGALDWIASPTAFRKTGEKQFRLTPVGAGPFTVVSNKLSTQLVLKKNPNYWQKGRPYLDRLTVTSIQGDEPALEAMQAGQAQAYETMFMPRLVSSFKDKFTVVPQPGSSPYMLQMNTKIPPFNNIKARRAIYYATDVPLLDKKLFNDIYPVTESFMTPTDLFYPPHVPGYPTYNLAKAKALVKQLGGLNVTLIADSGATNPTLSVALQQMWQQAGITSKIRLLSLADLIQDFQGAWQISLQTGGSWDPAAGLGIGLRFTSNSPFSGVHDPALDRMIYAAQAAVDPATRKALYLKSSEYIAAHAYAPFLFGVPAWNIAARNVHGPGLTTTIPAVEGNPAIPWEDVYETK